jgi:phage tail protein X
MAILYQEAHRAIRHEVMRAIDHGDWATLEAHPGLHETRQSVPAVLAAFPDLCSSIEQAMVADWRVTILVHC